MRIPNSRIEELKASLEQKTSTLAKLEKKVKALRLKAKKENVYEHLSHFKAINIAKNKVL